MLSYLDNAASTPLRPEAAQVIRDAAEGAYSGNPSGSHAVARRAKYALEEAREVFAACLGARPAEMVFTSGGTESDNLAIAGAVARRGGIPVCPATEHHAVLRTVEKLGGRVVGVRSDGRVDLEKLAASLGPDVTVVSVMLVNNETGVVNDLVPVARLIRKRAPGAILHTDAVQAFPWSDLAAVAAPAALVSVSAHKFGGPIGVGALVVRERSAIDPIVSGGEQERSLRSGTQDVAGVVAASAAARATVAARSVELPRIAGLADRLVGGIVGGVEGVRPTVPAGVPKVPGIAHITVEGIESEELLVLLDEAGVCASAGSACASGAAEPSHVLTAMGMSAAAAGSAVRFSLGWATTEGEVDHAIGAMVEAVGRLRRSAVPG